MITFKKEYPDIILLVCKAKEVHSATQADLKDCESIIEEIKKFHRLHNNNLLSVIRVLSQCDEVAPPKAGMENEKKQKNIQELQISFHAQIQKREKLRECLKTVVPTCAYAEYEEGESGLIISYEDYRWNIDTLIKTMMEYTPKERLGSIARMGGKKETLRIVAKMVQGSYVVISGFVSAIPIPGVSVSSAAMIQTAMIMHIGWLSGRAFSNDTVRDFKDFLVTAGIGIGTNAGMIGIGDLALLLLPGFGSAISSATAIAATQGIGDAAIAYFLKDD